MKLIKQTKLHFREGNSNKVYEADLCEVGDGQYVVNFRYGKHGASLVEGTKTASPVSLDKAQDTFDKIIKEKTAKGYQDVSAGGEAADPLVFVRTGVSEDDRKNAVLWHLSLGVSNPVKQRTKRWNIKRAIWRAGQLQLVEAVPHLLGLFGKGLAAEVELYNYCILWALAHCAKNAPEHHAAAIACLAQYADDEKASGMVQNIAKSGLVMLLADEARAAFFEKIRTSLPDAIGKNVNNPTKLKEIILGYITERARQVHAVSFIYDLYLLSLEQRNLHSVIVYAVQNMPLRANFFKHTRAIYKTALQHSDARMVGTIAAKFDQSKGSNFRMHHRISVGGQRITNRQAISRPDSPVANSRATNQKLRDMGITVSEQFAAAPAVAYIQFATAYLLGFDDNNAGYNDTRISSETKWKYDYKTRKYNTTKFYFPPYASALIFGSLLYKSHSQVEFNKKKKKWAFKSTTADYTPEKDATFTEGRSEQHSAYWDANPQALAHLVIETNSTPVFTFALRALKNNAKYEEFLAKFDLNLLLSMLETKIEAKAQFAFNILKSKFKPSDIPANTIVSFLKSKYAFMRTFALECMSANAEMYFADTEIIAGFLTSDDNVLRDWVSKNWNSIIAVWNEDKRQIFITRIISFLMQSNYRSDTNRINNLTRIILNSFSAQLKTLNAKVAGDLLGHSRNEIAIFGSQIFFLQYSNSPELMPQENLLSLLSHSNDTIANTGREILRKYPISAVVMQLPLFMSLYLNHKNVHVANLAKTLILEALPTSADFGIELLNAFVSALLKKETRDGVHLEMYRLLTHELKANLPIIDRDVIFRLLNAEHLYAQELAAILIKEFVDMTTFAVRNIVRLANHKVLNVRQIAWNAFNNQIPRMRYEAEEALRLLDSDWEDSRSFARTYFRNNFTAENWTPQFLVSLCDSVREDVQAFGTELLTKFFTEANGADYLLQLSQHPRPRLQLYATNYLDRYAANQPETIAKLEQYFVTVLSQVNRGRIAKDRIFAFLHRESLKNETVARLVADIIGRISATNLIQDRARTIEILRDIHLQFAQLPSVAVFE
jgi:predicted DNA-binding WGR domain protein